MFRTLVIGGRAGRYEGDSLSERDGLEFLLHRPDPGDVRGQAGMVGGSGVVAQQLLPRQVGQNHRLPGGQPVPGRKRDHLRIGVQRRDPQPGTGDGRAYPRDIDPAVKHGRVLLVPLDALRDHRHAGVLPGKQLHHVGDDDARPEPDGEPDRRSAGRPHPPAGCSRPGEQRLALACEHASGLG